jgi:hypothetical protein
MSSLPIIATTPSRPEDLVVRDTPPLIATPVATSTATSPMRAPTLIALSFAFDSIAKTLNVVIRDEHSGEIVRTIAYKNIPHDIHQTHKLNGLLLNQLA